MMKFLIILLDANCPSYCAYENSKAQGELMPIDVLQKGLHYALIENLYVQVVYPDYELSKEYFDVLDTIDKIGIASVGSLNQKSADVFVVNEWDKIESLEVQTDVTYILCTSKEPLFEKYPILFDFCYRVKRLNLVLTDIETFAEDDFAKYQDVLDAFSDTVVSRFKKDGVLPNINVLSDRITLNQMNNCNAGLESITLAPDGNLYVCPAFYYEKKPVGNINTGLCIMNPQLYKIENAPICSLCDAYQCKRCVWLNKKMTLEVNTPSHEQCVVSHIERNASRELLIQLKKCGFQSNSKIKRINYLDPFEKLFADGFARKIQ